VYLAAFPNTVDRPATKPVLDEFVARFGEKFPEKKLLRAGLLQADWTINRNPATSVIVSRSMVVVIGYHAEADKPTLCKLEERWLVENATGPNSWGPVEVGAIHHASDQRGTHNGMSIECDKLR